MPFIIVVPQIDAKQIEPNRMFEFLLEHLLPGDAKDTFIDGGVCGNMNHNQIVFEKLRKNENQWTMNGMRMLRTVVLNNLLTAVYIDGILGDDLKNSFAKRNIQEVGNSYNAPQRLEMKNATKEEQQHRAREQRPPSALLAFLAGMKSGTKVFQHFLNKSNLTQDLEGMYGDIERNLRKDPFLIQASCEYRLSEFVRQLGRRLL